MKLHPSCTKPFSLLPRGRLMGTIALEHLIPDVSNDCFVSVSWNDVRKEINDPKLQCLLLIYNSLLTEKLARGIDLHQVYQLLLPQPLVKLVCCFKSNGKVASYSIILTVTMQIGYSWLITGEALLCRCLISGFCKVLVFPVKYQMN
jgi:hypothetical protein